MPRLPEKCASGAHFDLQHALSCKKGGFVTLRHNMIRDVTARLLKEACHDVRVEPQLLPITGEDLKEATANKSSEARLDISARSVWITGQKAFLDVRVFNPYIFFCTTRSRLRCKNSNWFVFSLVSF